MPLEGSSRTPFNGPAAPCGVIARPQLRANQQKLLGSGVFERVSMLVGSPLRQGLSQPQACKARCLPERSLRGSGSAERTMTSIFYGNGKEGAHLGGADRVQPELPPASEHHAPGSNGEERGESRQIGHAGTAADAPQTVHDSDDEGSVAGDEGDDEGGADSDSDVEGGAASDGDVEGVDWGRDRDAMCDPNDAAPSTSGGEGVQGAAEKPTPAVGGALRWRLRSAARAEQGRANGAEQKHREVVSESGKRLKARGALATKQDRRRNPQGHRAARTARGKKWWEVNKVVKLTVEEHAGVPVQWLLIRWEDYTSKEDSWQPVTGCDCTEAIQDHLDHLRATLGRPLVDDTIRMATAQDIALGVATVKEVTRGGVKKLLVVHFQRTRAQHRL